ncbi:MAG: N-acetyltransferase [Deltaproteobacteria bacterium]|nr:N-acetyltransferase [Deltaproteobacteria bacterium]
MSRELQVHPTATVDDGAILGDGTRVWHYSHVSAGAQIGARCVLGQNVYVGSRASMGDGVKIQNNVSVYDEVHLEEDVFCGPSMVFTNVINPRAFIERKKEYRTTLVRQGATLGANCTILCGVTIGRFAMVGAGAVITHDVPDYALVVGVPGKQRGWVCRCGVTLGKSEPSLCAACGQSYQLDEAGKKLRERS